MRLQVPGNALLKYMTCACVHAVVPPKKKHLCTLLHTSLTWAHSSICCIVFHGALIHAIVERDYTASVLPSLRVFKLKSREGIVERIYNYIIIYIANLRLFVYSLGFIHTILFTFYGKINFDVHSCMTNGV